ncbi:thioredoxin-dependent thiol peroxidase [Ruicaihuangia caeni]|uniref:thioredoxin-dependent thiol peroxidase n=1 Tax=Ruicaihuangia caeni TaxID=3042517 RepID=UPI003390522F
MTEPRLNPGDAAPAFTLNDQDGTPVSLADFTGRKVIAFFYPAAMTPGCTKQACDFRDSLEPLQRAGYAVVGISKDAVDKQRRFADRDALQYPLLSDEDLSVHRAYHVWGPKNLYGKLFDGVHRSTFVIDEHGRIEHALYNVRATGHVARLRKMLSVDEG